MNGCSSHRWLSCMADKTTNPASAIGFRDESGKVSDTQLHEAIMSGVDDAALRTVSARRAIDNLGLSRDQADEAFGVKLST